MMVANCVDMSKWGGELTAAEAAAMRADGIRKVIVGTGNPAPGGAGQWSRQQADAAIKAGLDLEAYIYLYMAGSPEGQVQQAMNTMQGIDVGFWWLDAEDVSSPQLTTGERITFLNRCISYLNSHEITDLGIYTGRWWWVPNMQNSSAFAHLPLWNSWYDGDPDPDGFPYGGWFTSTVEQFTGTTILHGHSVDLNYDYRYDEEDDMGVTEERVREIIREELLKFDDVDDDDRLRQVMVARNKIERLANDIDANKVERAVALLTDGGILE